MRRTLRHALSLFAMLAPTLVGGVAAADVVDDYVLLFQGFADAADAGKADCATLTAGLAAYLEANAARLNEVGTTIRTTKAPMTADQEKALDGHLERFKAASDPCPDATLMLLAMVAPLMEEGGGDEVAEAEVPPADVAEPEVADPKTAATPKAKPKEAKPAVTVAQVQALCAEWQTSVKLFSKDCGALGKRLQRQFKGLSFKLDAVPRYGDYRKSLKVCKDAVKAAEKCDGNAEMQAARSILGEL